MDIQYMDADDFIDFGEEVEPIEEPEQLSAEEPTEEVETTPDPAVETTEEDYTPIYNTLKTLNVLRTEDDFEFDGTPEKLEEAFELTKKSLYDEALSSLWESLSDDFKPALAFALKGNVSLSDYLQVFGPTDLDKYDLTTKEAQRAIIYREYKETSKLPDERIKKIIATLEENDDLEEEAQSSLVTLREMNEDKKKSFAAQAEKEEQAKAERYKEQVTRLSTAIESSGLEKSRQNKVRAFLFNPIKVDTQETTSYAYTINRILNNPEHLIQFADLLADYNPEKGLDFTRFEKRVKTKATQTFKEVINSQLDSKFKGSTKTTKEDFDWDSFLKS